MNRLEFITDLIGAICVFALPFGLLFIAHGLGWGAM
jgi:hypothetical protein